jgi:hypothetical protein
VRAAVQVAWSTPGGAVFMSRRWPFAPAGGPPWPAACPFGGAWPLGGAWPSARAGR